MPPVSSFISLSRDNLINFMTSADFFEANPLLQSLEGQIAECVKNRQETDAKKTCNCGGISVKPMLPCVDAVVTALEELKATGAAATEAFVRYVSKKPTGSEYLTNVTIYYAKQGEQQPKRYEFIA